MLLSLPTELTEQVLSATSPVDVLRFSQVSKAAAIHASSSHLWSILFRNTPFDAPASPDFDFRTQLIRRTKAKKWATTSQDSQQHAFVLQCFTDIIQDVLLSTLSEQNCTPSLDLQWVADACAQAPFLEAKPVPSNTFLHSRLRSFLAHSLTPLSNLLDSTALHIQRPELINPVERRTKSRTQVYDLRNYRPDNSWGPYLVDGKINWVHIEALINVILYNLTTIPKPHASSSAPPHPPLGLDALKAYSAPGTCPSKVDDWAGVEGTWRRYVSFMDYRDLYAFNFSPTSFHSDASPYASASETPGVTTRDPAFFTQPSFVEATRLLEIELHIVDPSQMRFRPLRSDFHDGTLALPRPSSGRRSSSPAARRYGRSPSPHAIKQSESPIVKHLERYQPIHFAGTSRSANGAGSPVEGVVTMGADGIPRWRFVRIISLSCSLSIAYPFLFP